MTFTNLPNDEVIFLNENTVLRDYFYNILIQIKNSDRQQIRFIPCRNSYERRIVHILAQSLGLYHSRYGEWDEYELNAISRLSHYNQCDCKYCHGRKYRWKYLAERCFRFLGVNVANIPIPLSRKDRFHQQNAIKN